MKRKKPEGEDLQAFVEEWYASDHIGKVALAEKEYNVSYDTAKHWVSESGLAQKKPKMTISTDELLDMKPRVELDFVSFDVETSNLQADFSILMTACIKPYGKEPVVFRADSYPEWESNRANDAKITRDIVNELRKHAIVITHYGVRFDIPYLRAKMVKHGLEPLPPMFGIDSWRIARDNFKVSSRRLKNLANYFDIGEKEVVEGGLWMEAAYNGSKEALDKIVAHNIQDVLILEKLACISFPYLKSIPKL